MPWAALLPITFSSHKPRDLRQQPTHNWRLTAEEEATAVAELTHVAPGWARLLAECAGLALGYGEHQIDAARYRQIAELCVAAGVDETLRHLAR